MSDPEQGGESTSPAAAAKPEGSANDDQSSEAKGDVVAATKPTTSSGSATAAARDRGLTTTQTSATSPFAGADARAQADAKKRLGQTVIGIAPPAMGSKGPPAQPAASKPGGSLSPARTLAFGSESSKTAAPAPPRPQGASDGPTSKPPPAPGKPPVPSKPPPVPSKPPPVVVTKSSPPSPFTDTLVAAAPPLPPEVSSPPATTSRSSTSATPSADGPESAPVSSAPPIVPIVPRRRTPAGGIPAAKPVSAPPPPDAKATVPSPVAKAGGAAAEPRVAQVPPPVVTEKPNEAPSLAPVGIGSVPPPIPPPVIRIPQGGLLGASAPMRSERAGTLICEILVKNGAVTQEMVDKALAIQEERGGQIGRILVSMGACGEDAIAQALLEQLRLRKDGGYMSDISLAARERKDVVGLKVLTRPMRTVAVLLLTDLFSLLLAALLATSVHWFRTYSELQTLDWTAWLVVGPSIALCMLTFLGLELYSPMAKSTPDEIRDITFSVSLVHFGASLLSTLGDLPIVKWGVFVRGVWWVATLFLVPIIRAYVRNYFAVQPWWGIPVCVLGAAKTGRLVVRTLKAQPRSGLKPVMLLDDDKSKLGTLRASFTNEVMDVYSVNVSAASFLTDAQRAELAQDIFGDDEVERASQPISSDHIPVAPPAKVDVKMPPPAPQGTEEQRKSRDFFNPDSQSASRSQITKNASQFPRGKFAEVEGVPIVGDLSLAPVLADRLNIPYAVIAMPGVHSSKLLQIVERIGGKFTHLLIIPDLFGFATMGVPAKSLGGILGVEVRQQLLLPGPRFAKRCMDLALTIVGGLLVLPFLLIIALLIKLDSKGPVLYKQKRLGKDGSYFTAYKFRTMHGDGEERLKAILESDPALRAEYEIYHKLRKDPRITRIGRVLRKFSLDEFPQLLNVLKGEMSLVGPRPYIERELTEMGGQEKIILRAPPGMTGMWQVSDRNATSFAQRVQIDVYYVRNWSPWLDIHILAKTFGVVIKGTGV